MTDENQFNTIPDNKSVIVVSDLHLGLAGQEGVNKNFSDFLIYLAKLIPKDAPGEHTIIPIDGKDRELYAPDTIVLLGDIVDLWSPRNNIYSSVLEDSYTLISSLLNFPAKIVYIAGNHDEEFAEIEGNFPKCLPSKVKIIKDHFPDNSICKDGVKQYTGIKIGNLRYFFLHGHQFDKTFNCAGIFQNYPGWVAKNYMLFRENPLLKSVLRLIWGLSLIFLISAFIWRIPTLLLELAFFVLGLTSVICLFTFTPATIRSLYDIFISRVKAKTATIETIIEDGFWKPEAGKNLLADVVIFGHTHIADDSKSRYQGEYNKRFINSGNWGPIKTRTSDNNESEINTFIYIDTEGPLLFYWPVAGQTPAYISKTLTEDQKG